MGVAKRFAFVAGLAMGCAVACSSPPPPPTCDQPGSACCGGACMGNLVCNNGTCARPHEVPDAGPCGDVAQPCCAGQHCNALLTCSGNVCVDPVGQPCTKNSECLSQLCLLVGGGPTGNVCTLECDADAGCRAGWTCGPYAGVPMTICQCLYKPETCNGLDDDCDGVIDGAAAAAWCAASDAGSSCAQGACAP